MSRELGPDVSSCPLCGSTTLRDVPGLPASVWCVDCGIVAVDEEEGGVVSDDYA